MLDFAARQRRAQARRNADLATPPPKRRPNRAERRALGRKRDAKIERRRREREARVNRPSPGAYLPAPLPSQESERSRLAPTLAAAVALAASVLSPR